MQDNRTAIIKSYEMIKALKPYANKNLRDLIGGLRTFIHENIKVDPYSSRDRWERWDPPKRGCVKVQVGTMNCHHTEFVYAKRVWKDDYVKWLSDTSRKLHDRDIEFRINDNFYNYVDYFEYEGKAYAKENYIMYEGKPIEKTKVSTCDYYIYADNRRPTRVQVALMPQDGEMFVRHNDSVNAFVSIEVDVTYYGSKLLCEEFVKSMFCVGNERESLYSGHIYLTAEQLKKFKFKPMSSHIKEFAKRVKIPEDVAMEEMMKELQQANFYIKQPNRPSSASLKQKLLNIITKTRTRRSYSESCIGLKELFIRLRAISKMNDVEVQYAK